MASESYSKKVYLSDNINSNIIICCGTKLALINGFKNLKSKIQEKNEERKNQWDKAYFFGFASERLANKGRILDLGCGRCYFLKISDDNAFGIDGNIKNLKEAQEHTTEVVQGDFRRPLLMEYIVLTL